MEELVNAISNLCKLLDCLIGVSLKPDFFRLSKLNKLKFEQVQQIWNALHKICCFSTKNAACNNVPYKCIQSYLRKQGGAAAYILTPDATARQLLLCFGFLLSERIIEINIDKVLNATPLSEELPSFMVETDIADDFTDESFSVPDNDPNALLNYALFVSGKVQHNLRAVANYNQEKVQLFSKIHKATAGTYGIPHLSVGDLLMNVHPELQAQFLSRCQHCIPLLQAYSKWYRKRHVFWDWMVSMVEEEFKIKSKSKQHSVAEITYLHEFLRNLKSDVQKMTEEVQVTKDDSLFEDSNTQVPARRMCLGKHGEALDSLIKNMDLEINNLQVDNEKKMEEIKMNLFRTGNQCSAINSVLETFGTIRSRKKEISTASGIELPLLDKLQSLRTD